MNVIHVYLDDYRACPRGFVAAKNAEECKLLIDEEQIGVLSLDYDLGWGQPTGAEVAEHLALSGRYPQEIYLHSSSAAGRIQMYQLLSQRLPSTSRLVNGPMPVERLAQIAAEADGGN